MGLIGLFLTMMMFGAFIVLMVWAWKDAYGDKSESS